jgi:hypothetical protein
VNYELIKKEKERKKKKKKKKKKKRKENIYLHEGISWEWKVTRFYKVKWQNKWLSLGIYIGRWYFQPI